MPTLTVSSFKGGTAKTSIALHVASALAKFHKQKVLLIDFDAQANLTAGFGYDPDEQQSLAAVLQGEKTIEEVILSTSVKGLDLIAADTWLERVEVTAALASDRYSHERLKKLLAPLKYDYIIIDTPPSLCWLTESALIASDHSLVCATAEFYSVKGLQRLSSFLEAIASRHKLSILGVALSFWNPRGKSNQTFLQAIETTFPGKLLNAKIRRDVSVSEAAIYGKPLFEVAPKTRAAEDFRALTEELIKKCKADLHEKDKRTS